MKRALPWILAAIAVLGLAASFLNFSASAAASVATTHFIGNSSSVPIWPKRKRRS